MKILSIFLIILLISLISVTVSERLRTKGEKCYKRNQSNCQTSETNPQGRKCVWDSNKNKCKAKI